MPLQRIESNPRMSAAVVHADVVFLAGQVPDDRGLGAAGQTREVLAKIDRLLAAAGSSREHLLSAQIWLKDIDADFAAMNEVWIDWLPAGCAPARATVQARLASPEVLVEIMVKEGTAMNHQIRNSLLGITLAGALASALASTSVLAQERFVTIGTGGQTGVYYTAGQSVCRFLNRAEVKPAIKCNAPSTAGSVTNIVSLHKGEYDFGFIQSDHQHKALQGLAPFDKESAVELRAVFSLQSEILTVVVRNDSGITDLAGLEGKRVNIGVPGSGSRDTFEEVMQAKGWTNASFALAAELKPAEMASALGDNNLDAITYVVGHPSGAIQEALTNVKARIIPVQGAEIDSLLAKADYYSAVEIPAGLYPGVEGAIPSIGGKAVLATTSKTDPEVVYQLVKSVFDNLDRFKRLHPAFADLKAEDMIRVGLTAPLHEGAERYYKEKGWL